MCNIWTNVSSSWERNQAFHLNLKYFEPFEFVLWFITEIVFLILPFCRTRRKNLRNFLVLQPISHFSIFYSFTLIGIHKHLITKLSIFWKTVLSQKAFSGILLKNVFMFSRKFQNSHNLININQYLCYNKYNSTSENM